jgi:hypothetical protein
MSGDERLVQAVGIASLFTGAGEVDVAAEGIDLAAEGVEAVGADAINIWGENTAGSAQVQVLQTGGRTIASGTADALNEANGMDLTSREWGRALEGLKSDAIDSVGNYSNPATGEILGNILEYLP